MKRLLPDEIVWIDEQIETDEARNLNVRNIKVTFRDGSYLRLGARARRPPLSEMTNELVEGYDPTTGQMAMDWDDGSTEAWEISERSTAFRMIDKLLRTVKKLPEQPKTDCRHCAGGFCPYCQGRGCVECNRTGICPRCHGRGKVIRDHT